MEGWILGRYRLCHVTCYAACEFPSQMRDSDYGLALDRDSDRRIRQILREVPVRIQAIGPACQVPTTSVEQSELSAMTGC